MPAYLQGGTVVNHDSKFVADVLVHNDKIQQVGLDLKACGGLGTRGQGWMWAGGGLGI